MANTLLDISRRIGDIAKELAILYGKLIKGKDNLHVYGGFLDNSLEHVKWLNKEIDLRNQRGPDIIEHRDIFFAELGYNIGSEQNKIRPVVVLQNNAINAHSSVVTVAPITTHNHGEITANENGIFLRRIVDGQEIISPLRYFEIPIELESGYRQEVLGVINISQIRTISKKRMRRLPVARITRENYTAVQNAIARFLCFNE